MKVIIPCDLLQLQVQSLRDLLCLHMQGGGIKEVVPFVGVALA